MSKRIRLRGEEHTWTVEIGDHDVWVEGVDSPFAIEASADGGYDVTYDGQIAHGFVAVNSDTIWVELDQHIFEFSVLHGRSGAAAHDLDALLAPMSATVTRVAVAVGDRVSAGDVLVALEAMKMELPIRAPRDGVVTAVNCRKGDLVQSGQELVGMGSEP